MPLFISFDSEWPCFPCGIPYVSSKMRVKSRSGFFVSCAFDFGSASDSYPELFFSRSLDLLSSALRSFLLHCLSSGVSEGLVVVIYISSKVLCRWSGSLNDRGNVCATIVPLRRVSRAEMDTFPVDV